MSGLPVLSGLADIGVSASLFIGLIEGDSCIGLFVSGVYACLLWPQNLISLNIEKVQWEQMIKVSDFPFVVAQWAPSGSLSLCWFSVTSSMEPLNWKYFPLVLLFTHLNRTSTMPLKRKTVEVLLICSSLHFYTHFHMDRWILEK